jgi:hypothetical protein
VELRVGSGEFALQRDELRSQIALLRETLARQTTELGAALVVLCLRPIAHGT